MSDVMSVTLRTSDVKCDLKQVGNRNCTNARRDAPNDRRGSQTPQVMALSDVGPEGRVSAQYGDVLGSPVNHRNQLDFRPTDPPPGRSTTVVIGPDSAVTNSGDHRWDELGTTMPG